MKIRNKEQFDKMKWLHKKDQHLSAFVQWNLMHVLKTNMQHRVHVSILAELVRSNAKAIFLTLSHTVPLVENDPEMKVAVPLASESIIMPLKRIRAILLLAWQTTQKHHTRSQF